MCVLALILPEGITIPYAGLAGVAMRGRYAGLTLPNRTCCCGKTSSLERYCLAPLLAIGK